MDIATIAIAVVVGVLIGVLSGMLGIGGGTVMVPVFKLGFAMTAIQATATSLFAIIPTSISGAIAHIRQKTCIPKLGLLAGIGGAVTSPMGVLLAQHSPGWAIMLVAAIVIGYSAITMFRKALAAPKRADAPAAVKAPSAAAADTADSTLKASEWWGLPIGALAGLVAGYVGVGGGFLMVPMFLSLLDVSMKKASGTSLLAIAILTVPGAITQIVLGNVQIAIALAIVIGSIPGSVLGTCLLKRIPERQLRFCFAAMLLVAAIMLVVQELGLV